jgi:hypothetical protein
VNDINEHLGRVVSEQAWHERAPNTELNAYSSSSSTLLM